MPKPSKTGVRGLYRDGDGRFRIDLRWEEPKTGQIRRYKERLPEGIPAAAAKRRAQEVLAAALAGGWQPGDAGGPKRLSKAFTEYLDTIGTNLGPRAKRDRGQHRDQWIAILGDVPVINITEIGFQKFKTVRKESGVAPGTINRAITTMKHFLSFASSRGWLPKEKAIELREIKQMKEPPGRVRYLSDDERGRLDAALTTPRRRFTRPVILAYLLSGMRRSELVTLRKDAVDLPRRVLTLTKTKNGKVRRIPINDALAAVLEGAMAIAEGEYVFTSRLGTPYTPDGISSTFAKLIKDAGIEDFHLHDLRHDFATRLRRNQTGLDVIAKLLGHSSLQMTTRYAHLDDPTLHAAVASLNFVAPSMPPGSSAAKSSAS